MKDRGVLTLFIFGLGLLWLISGPQVGGCTLPVVPDIFGPPAGPRLGLLVHEAKTDTPTQAKAFTDLRDGPAREYLAGKKHTLLILDKDSKDRDGSPSPIITKWQPFKPPELLIIAPPDKLLDRQTLPPDATADTVLTAFKAKGG